MNTIFESKQEFVDQYKDAVAALSGKTIEKTSDIDRFNALASLIASKARNVSTKSESA